MPLNPYNPNPCQNAGTCIPDLTDQTYVCQCGSGFAGTNCEGNIIIFLGGGGLCLPFCFVLIVFFIFFYYTICMLFINRIENCYDCTLYLLFVYCNFDIVHSQYDCMIVVLISVKYIFLLCQWLI